MTPGENKNLTPDAVEFSGGGSNFQHKNNRIGFLPTSDYLIALQEAMGFPICWSPSFGTDLEGIRDPARFSDF